MESKTTMSSGSRRTDNIQEQVTEVKMPDERDFVGVADLSPEELGKMYFSVIEDNEQIDKGVLMRRVLDAMTEAGVEIPTDQILADTDASDPGDPASDNG